MKSELSLEQINKLLLQEEALNLPDIFFTAELGMSDIQIKHFVLRDNEFCTPFAKAKQAKFEIWNRLVELQNMAYDAQEALILAQKYEAEAKEASSPFDRELLRVRAQKKRFQYWVLRQRAWAIAQEIRSFYEAYQEAAAQGGDPQDPEERRRLEVEYWQKRMEAEPEVFWERYWLTPEKLAEKALPKKEASHEAR